MRLPIAAIGVVALAATGVALAQTPAQAPAQAPARPSGYLSGPALPEASKILYPPPPEDGERQLQELGVFRATRALNGSPRWAMAQADNDYTAPAMMRHFACSLGVSLDSQSAPRLARALQRMTIDAGGASNTAKQVFQRKRPYLFVDGEICIAKSQGLADSPDYPSGHSSLGWGAGLMLAELAPERSTQIMTRARAFGDSRVVCGVHTPSAIEAGRSVASAVFAAQHGSDEFRADMAAARTEIAAARAAGKTPTPAACTAETEILAKAPF